MNDRQPRLLIKNGTLIMTISASPPDAITPISPSRPMSQALPLVFASIASIGVMPTSLTNSSASLPCHLPWGNAEALPLSLPLRIAIPRARALRIIWKLRSNCLRSRSRIRSP